MSPSGGRNKQNIWNYHRVSHFHVWWAPPTVITWVVMAMPGGSWRIFDCPKDQRLDPPMGSGEWTCITQGCTGPQNNAGFEGSGYLRLRVLKKKHRPTCGDLYHHNTVDLVGCVVLTVSVQPSAYLDWSWQWSCNFFIFTIIKSTVCSCQKFTKSCVFQMSWCHVMHYWLDDRYYRLIYRY